MDILTGPGSGFFPRSSREVHTLFLALWYSDQRTELCSARLWAHNVDYFKLQNVWQLVTQQEKINTSCLSSHSKPGQSSLHSKCWNFILRGFYHDPHWDLEPSLSYKPSTLHTEARVLAYALSAFLLGFHLSLTKMKCSSCLGIKPKDHHLLGYNELQSSFFTQIPSHWLPIVKQFFN